MTKPARKEPVIVNTITNGKLTGSRIETRAVFKRGDREVVNFLGGVRGITRDAQGHAVWDFHTLVSGFRQTSCECALGAACSWIRKD